MLKYSASLRRLASFLVVPISKRCWRQFVLCVLSSLSKVWVFKEEVQKDLINVYKRLIGECKEDEPLLFPVVPRVIKRDNGHKVKHVNSV